MAGLYIHIPFCKSRCIYCGFYSSTLHSLRPQYVDALCSEMLLRAHELRGQQVETIYLGGGTPSQLSDKELRQIFSHLFNIYDVSAEAEVTIECNPDDISDSFAALLAQLPVNRVSMGAQTFDDQRLRLLHRRHTASQVDKAVGRLRAAGLTNLSIDLMFGFPAESLQQWDYDISRAIELAPKHISAYALTYEPNTPLHRLSQRDERYAPISEERSLAMYHLLIDRMQAAGYEHYEISNFAQPGYHSRHNSSYWQAKPYLGLGAAAHSYDLDTRSWNVSDIRRYIEAIEQGRRPLEEREVLTTSDRFDDLVMTALRTRQGLSLDDVTHRFGPAYREHLLAAARPHLDRHLLVLDDDRLHLTRDGLFLSDGIMSDLMYV